MKTPRTVCVIGTFPDRFNTNKNIRHFIASGCAEFYSDAKVYDLHHEEFFEKVPGLKPDLCLFVGSILASEFQIQSMLDKARSLGACVVVWLHDDPYEFDAGYRLAGLVHAVFSNDKAATYHYPASIPAFHLPMAAPRSAASANLDRGGFDFFFSGYPYPSRLAFFSEINLTLVQQSQVLQGCVIGPDWDQARVPFSKNLRINQFSLYKNYRDSLATIYLGRDLNLKNERFRIRPTSPAPRLFEAAALGACQIAMTPGLEILHYFDDNSEMFLVESAAEAAEHLIRLRRQPSESVAVGLKAQARVLKNHLYVHRIAQMNGVLGKL